MGTGGLIEFQTAGIDDIGSQTLKQQQLWDSVWNNTYNRLKATASDAMDVLTGGGLDQRSAEYHQKSVRYTQNVQQQGQAVNQISTIATDTNTAMVRTIRGAG